MKKECKLFQRVLFLLDHLSWASVTLSECFLSVMCHLWEPNPPIHLLFLSSLLQEADAL